MATFIFYNLNGQEIVLDDNKEINRGGEGRLIIPENITDKIAKIYHDNIKPIPIKKFEEISKIKNHIFVMPQDLLLDKHKIVKGFLMELLPATFFPIATIFNKNFCLKNNIDYDFKNNIINKLIEAVKFAHSHKIILGDFNQYNIMINLSGDVKIIDTDSFATENFNHSQILLDEIRDYLYHGNVNYNSDYFALSVIVFYMQTFAHPFKGIHKKYKTLAERMINRTPIFAKDPELTTPKCYQELTETELIEQYNQLYIEGKRFIISNDKAHKQIQQITKPTLTTYIEKDKIIINFILANTNILDINFNKTMGYVQTNDLFIIYNTENKGFITKIAEISKAKADKVFVGNKNIIFSKDNNLFHYVSDTKIDKIKNFEVANNQIFQQYENLLLILQGDILYKMYIDEVMSCSINLQRTNVFGRAFRKANSFIQNIGGINRIFYNTGKDLSNLKFDTNILDIKQAENYFIYQTIVNKEIKNIIKKINALTVEDVKYELPYFADFTYMSNTKNEGIIFIPADNKILCLQTTNFNIISEIECEYVSEHAKIAYTKSGILLLNDGNLFLINNKKAS